MFSFSYCILVHILFSQICTYIYRIKEIIMEFLWNYIWLLSTFSVYNISGFSSWNDGCFCCKYLVMRSDWCDQIGSDNLWQYFIWCTYQFRLHWDICTGYVSKYSFWWFQGHRNVSSQCGWFDFDWNNIHYGGKYDCLWDPVQLGVTSSFHHILWRLSRFWFSWLGLKDHVYPKFLDVMQYLADSYLLEMIVHKLVPSVSRLLSVTVFFMIPFSHNLV